MVSAYKELEKNGYIFSRTGSGSYVAEVPDIIDTEAAIEAAQKALQEKYPVADELSGYTVWADYVTGINANTGGSITSEGTELPPPPYYIVYFAAPGHAYDISDYAVVVQPQDGYVQYIGGPDRSNG